MIGDNRRQEERRRRKGGEEDRVGNTVWQHCVATPWMRRTECDVSCCDSCVENVRNTRTVVRRVKDRLNEIYIACVLQCSDQAASTLKVSAVYSSVFHPCTRSPFLPSLGPNCPSRLALGTFKKKLAVYLSVVRWHYVPACCCVTLSRSTKC